MVNDLHKRECHLFVNDSLFMRPKIYEFYLKCHS